MSFKKSKFQAEKKDFLEEMRQTANILCYGSKKAELDVITNKGLLAADESTGTIDKKFKKIGLENTEDNRRKYRQMLFTTEGIEQFISGVILYEETLFQKTDDGKPFVEILKSKGIIPGIKTDMGIFELPGSNGLEGVTQGLDELFNRSAKYYEQGARFAKWRAQINVDKSKNLPSAACMKANADKLALYALISQANGLVPIVEPEVMIMEGDHDILFSYQVTRKMLNYTFAALEQYNVDLSRMILKPNMILPGNGWLEKNKMNELLDTEIAGLTLKALCETVPVIVPGIMFLSGGQSEEEAAKRLNEINKMAKEIGARKAPWLLSFSYGRALQNSAIDCWKGKQENVADAQKKFIQQAENCSKAVKGELKHMK